MLDFRSPLILGAAPVGAVLGVLGWLVLGGPGAPLRAVESVGVPTARPAAEAGGNSSALLSQAPPLMGAQAAGPEVSVRLAGLARRPGRIAALLSFNGGPLVWIAQGETQSGMTLIDVGSASVVLESVRGSVELKVGETTDSASPPAPVATDEPPTGARLPPEPSSAPQG